MVRILAIGIAAIFALYFMVNSTLKGANQRRNVISIYQKIMLNHVQLIILTAAFDLNWPMIFK